MASKGSFVNRHRSHCTKVSLLSVAAMVGVSVSGAFANDFVTNIPESVLMASEPTYPSGYKVEFLDSPKFTGSLVEVPQTVSIISNTVMEDQGVTTLREVLRNVPGISIQAGEGGVPAGDQLSIRGYSARTDLFVDGVRDIAGYSRDPFNFEQVEVIKGPASSYSGRGSAGGSVNLISKKPTEENFTHVSAGIGTEDYMRATLDTNQVISDEVSVRLNAMVHDASIAGRDKVKQSRWGVSPSMTMGQKGNTQFTLSYFYMEQDNLPDYGIPWVPFNTGALANESNQPAPVDFSNFYGLTSRDREETSTHIATGIINHEFSESVKFRNLLRYAEVNRFSIITAPRFESINENTDITRGDWKDRDQRDSILANQSDVTTTFETGNVSHTLVSGIEWSLEKETRYRLSPTGEASDSTNLWSPTPADRYAENLQRNGIKLVSEGNTLAAYVFDTLTLNEQWRVHAGLRWDRFELEFDNDGMDLGRVDKMISWKAGVVYRPRDNGSIYAGFGTAFNPSTESLVLSTSNTSLTGNAGVKPEESHSFEAGTKWDLFNGQLSLNAAIFQTQKVNARTQDPDDPNDSIVLKGEQRVRGFECAVVGSLTENWTLLAGYTLMDSEVLKSKDPNEKGKELGNTPRHSLSLWTTYRFNSKFEIGAGLNHVGERFNRTGDNNNRRAAPEYTTGNVMLSYLVREGVTLKLNASNLTNEEFIDFVGGGHFIPGQGRLVTFSTEIKF